MIDFDRNGFYDASHDEYLAEVADNARRGNTTKEIPTPVEIAARTADVRQRGLEQPVSPAKRGAAARKPKHGG
jgi:hypothetical protein